MPENPASPTRRKPARRRMPRKAEARKVDFIDKLKSQQVVDAPIEDIKVDDMTFQYRLGANVGDLKHSLEKEGQREPVDLTGNKPYRIIDGFRRVQAIRSLNWSTVKAFVHRGISDDEAHKLAFIKNVVRKNLSPMEKANAIYQAKHRGMKEKDLAQEFGLSEKQLGRYEALLDFPPEVQKLLDKDTISMAHAKVFADFKPRDLDGWVEKIKDGQSAKQVKRELRKASGARNLGKKKLYLKREKNSVRVYPFVIAKDSPKDERERVSKLLQETLEQIKAWE